MAGLRERQKQGRRRDLLAAASQLFRRDGFAETSIEQIAGRAGLSAGTVYNYFGSKRELLLALVALDGEEVRTAGAALIVDPPGDPVRAVRRLLESYLDHSLVHLDKRLWRQMMGIALFHAETRIGADYRALDRKLTEQVAALCLALQERGDIPAGVDCGDASEVLFNLCNSLFVEFVADDTIALDDLKERMSRQLGLAFRGILDIGAEDRGEAAGRRRSLRPAAAG